MTDVDVLVDAYEKMSVDARQVFVNLAVKYSESFPAAQDRKLRLVTTSVRSDSATIRPRYALGGDG
jgi:hypothetical protein